MTISYGVIGSVGDMFDKVKAKKSHYHHRYVCCIGSILGQRTIRAVLKRQDGKIVNELKIKKQADSVLMVMASCLEPGGVENCTSTILVVRQF